VKLAHRQCHRVTWFVLLPVLFIAVLLLSNTDRETMPVNESIPGLNQSVAVGGAGADSDNTEEFLEHRVLP